MEPKQPYFSKKPEAYHPVNGAAISGSSNSKDTDGVTVDDRKILKSQIIIRLQELEKQNEGLKSIIEQRKNDIANIIAANKKYISVLAHDLKSPFSTIYGVLGILKECIHQNHFDEMEQYIDIASSSALNSTNLIENILAWSAQTGEKRLMLIAVNLATLVEREIDNCKLAIKIKEISLSHTISPLLFVKADLQMTKSIIRNLITNAIKFTNPGGSIIISAREVESFIEITVKDDGIGISMNDQLQLFNPAPLGLMSENLNIKGHGLGLLLCKEFVELQGGTIEVESHPGKGSSFIFTLPNHA